MLDRHHIDGVWQSASGRTIDVFNPVTQLDERQDAPIALPDPARRAVSPVLIPTGRRSLPFRGLSTAGRQWEWR